MTLQFHTASALRQHYAGVHARLWTEPAPEPVGLVEPPPKPAPLVFTDPLGIPTVEYDPKATEAERIALVILAIRQLPMHPLRGAMMRQLTAKAFGMPDRALTGLDRNYKITRARMIAITLVRKSTTLTLHQVGKLFGDRDHTTIFHAERKLGPVVDAVIAEMGG